MKPDQPGWVCRQSSLGLPFPWCNAPGESSLNHNHLEELLSQGCCPAAGEGTAGQSWGQGWAARPALWPGRDCATPIRGARRGKPSESGVQPWEERRCKLLGTTPIQPEPTFWLLSVRSLDRMKLHCYLLLTLVSFPGVESAPCGIQKDHSSSREGRGAAHTLPGGRTLSRRSWPSPFHPFCQGSCPCLHPLQQRYFSFCRETRISVFPMKNWRKLLFRWLSQVPRGLYWPRESPKAVSMILRLGTSEVKPSF